ncbi:MAG: PorB subunit of pyruvate:flavodoxin oxidoreductase, partial [Candidatus Moranbacteria bacterium GW2011_GWE2_47_10]
MNKKLTEKLASGHSTCSGCGIPAIVRTVLGATEEPVIVANATGCL